MTLFRLCVSSCFLSNPRERIPYSANLEPKKEAGMAETAVPLESNCSTCRQLWQQYADATMAHIRLRGNQKRASLQRDHEPAASIQRNVIAADRVRHDARTALA